MAKRLVACGDMPHLQIRLLWQVEPMVREKIGPLKKSKWSPRQQQKNCQNTGTALRLDKKEVMPMIAVN
ncbi:MAG: hypothetical protein CR972_01760 [Candidatus Moraniibacteriota bacterium]|nr:MAG: hypothetical protein CR972_01760 [Candidatus Moranbacteria bacterium]